MSKPFYTPKDCGESSNTRQSGSESGPSAAKKEPVIMHLMVPPPDRKLEDNIGSNILAPIEDSMMHMHLDPYYNDEAFNKFSYTTISDTVEPPSCHNNVTSLAMNTSNATLSNEPGHHHNMGNMGDDTIPRTSHPSSMSMNHINHSSISGVVRLLADFGEKSRNSEWPMSTSVYCHWCCHPFQGVPIGLPIKMTMNEQQYCVTGCYCSLECACAYNFASRESVDERLSRYSLLNGLAVRIGCIAQTPIRPAPDRLALNIFGGHLSIDEFRVYASSSDRYIITNTSPMISVTQQLEELNEQDTHSEYRYVPLDSERVCRFQEKIKLKRNKPLLNTKNTLDQSMKLKITKNT